MSRAVTGSHGGIFCGCAPAIPLAPADTPLPYSRPVEP